MPHYSNCILLSPTHNNVVTQCHSTCDSILVHSCPVLAIQPSCILPCCHDPPIPSHLDRTLQFKSDASENGKNMHPVSHPACTGPIHSGKMHFRNNPCSPELPPYQFFPHIQPCIFPPQCPHRPPCSNCWSTNLTLCNTSGIK